MRSEKFFCFNAYYFCHKWPSDDMYIKKKKKHGRNPDRKFISLVEMRAIVW